MTNSLEVVLSLRRSLSGELQTAARNTSEIAQNTERQGRAAQVAIGPYQRLARIQEQIDRARRTYTPLPVLKDLRLAQQRAQEHIRRIERPEPDIKKRLMDAVYSSRFTLPGSGGAIQPLVGRTLAFLKVLPGPLKALAVGLLAAAKASEVMSKTAMATAENTRRFSALRAQVGGTGTDAARLRALGAITGVDAGGAAAGLQDRITSDPLAMGIAARYGVANRAGRYGRQDWGRQYLQLIKAVSANKDPESRFADARSLGIEQEVGVYSMLSMRSKKNLDRDASITARIHNPEQERRAAELTTAMRRAEGGTQAVKDAFGSLFSPGTTDMLNKYADVTYSLADKINNFNALIDHVRPGYGGKSALGKSMRSVDAVDGGSAGRSAMDINNTLLAENNAQLARLNGNFYGGGERGRGALPSAVWGNPQLAGDVRRAYELGALRYGTL